MPFCWEWTCDPTSSCLVGIDETEREIAVSKVEDEVADKVDKRVVVADKEVDRKVVDKIDKIVDRKVAKVVDREIVESNEIVDAEIAAGTQGAEIEGEAGVYIVTADIEAAVENENEDDNPDRPLLHNGFHRPRHPRKRRHVPHRDCVVCQAPMMLPNGG